MQVEIKWSSQQEVKKAAQGINGHKRGKRRTGRLDAFGRGSLVHRVHVAARAEQLLRRQRPAHPRHLPRPLRCPLQRHIGPVTSKPVPFYSIQDPNTTA